MRKRKRKRNLLLGAAAVGLLALLLTAAGAFALWPRPEQITHDNYERIRNGMSRADVEAILGPPNLPETELDTLDRDDFGPAETLRPWFEGPFWDAEAETHIWLGRAGIAVVVFEDGRAKHKVWTPLANPLKRQLRRWLP